MHRDWCGKECSICMEPCAIDELILCSLDCPNLSLDGEPSDCEECQLCDAARTDEW